MDDPPGHLQIIIQWEGGHPPPGVAARRQAGLRGFPVKSLVCLSGLHPVRGRGNLRLGHLSLCSITPLIRIRTTCISSCGAPLSHLDTIGAPPRATGNNHIPSPSDNIIILCVISVATVPLVPPFTTQNPTIFQKHQTVTKTLR